LRAEKFADKALTTGEEMTVSVKFAVRRRPAVISASPAASCTPSSW
jgi:hypothetical protein